MSDPEQKRVHAAAEAEIRRLLATEDDAWPAVEAAMRAFERPLTAFVMRRGANPADANDVLQDVWLVAYAGMAGMQSGSVRAWLFGIARNMLRRGYRKAKRDQLGVPISQVAQERLAERVQSSIAAWQRPEAKNAFQAQLRDELSGEQQLLIELVVDHKLTWDEVVCAMDAPEVPTGDAFTQRVDALTVRYHRLKKRLYKMAVERGLRPVSPC